MFAPQDGEYIEVVPAYGRDYKSKAEILNDLRDGKDFKLTTTGQYLNIDDIIRHKFRVIVRYGKLMKVTDVTPDLKRVIRQMTAKDE